MSLFDAVGKSQTSLTMRVSILPSTSSSTQRPHGALTSDVNRRLHWQLLASFMLGISPLPPPPSHWPRSWIRSSSPNSVLLPQFPSVKMLLAKARNVLTNASKLIRQASEHPYACGPWNEDLLVIKSLTKYFRSQTYSLFSSALNSRLGWLFDRNKLSRSRTCSVNSATQRIVFSLVVPELGRRIASLLADLP